MQPQGMPLEIASSSETPEESISGLGLTSSRDAGQTLTFRSDRAKCFRTSAFFASTCGKKAASTALTNGEAMQDLGGRTGLEYYSGGHFCLPVFAFSSPMILLPKESSVKMGEGKIDLLHSPTAITLMRHFLQWIEQTFWVFTDQGRIQSG
jgi:hypothetical protein